MTGARRSFGGFPAYRRGFGAVKGSKLDRCSWDFRSTRRAACQRGVFRGYRKVGARYLQVFFTDICWTYRLLLGTRQRPREIAGLASLRRQAGRRGTAQAQEGCPLGKTRDAFYWEVGLRFSLLVDRW